MNLLSIEQVKVGMVLGEDIYGSNDLLFASKGETVTEKLLLGLSRMGVDFLYIEADQVEEAPLLTDEERDEIIEVITMEYTSYRLLGKSVFTPIMTQVMQVVQALIIDDDSLAMLFSLHALETYSLKHCIHVSLLSGILGHWIGMSEQEITMLIVAGLFHDLGNLSVPKALLHKSGPLTSDEYAAIKEHTLKGIELVTSLSGSNDDILQAILQHHERRDGSGYPQGLRGSAIHPLASVIAVADTFDATVSDRPYRTAKSPVQACEEIFAESLDQLDPLVSTTLIKKVQKHYLGLTVQLSNGKVGEIVFINKFDPNKPLVKSGDEFYDLSTNTHIKIVGIG